MRPKKRIILTIILIVVLLSIGISYVQGDRGESVIISDGGSTGDEVTIDCLGNDNIITLYALSDENEQGRQQFRDTCDDTIKIPKQYMTQAQKLMIRSSEESETYINYEEYFDEIQNSEVLIEKSEYSDKVCFTLELRSYSDVEINDDLTQQVTDFYKCYKRGELQSAESSNEDKYKLIEIYVDDRLVKEYKIDKKREPFTLSFRDLGMNNDKFEDKMKLEFKNPINDQLKIEIQDTNLNCEKSSFTMASDYSLTCNKTEGEVPNYYVQAKSNKGNIVFEEHRVRNLEDDESDFPLTPFQTGLIILAIIVYYFYSKYSAGVQRKDKRAIDQLDEDDKN